jgi:hypothetical protein
MRGSICGDCVCRRMNKSNLKFSFENLSKIFMRSLGFPPSTLLVSVLPQNCCDLVHATTLPKTWRIWLAWYFPHSTRISLVPQRPRILWLKTKAIGEISDSDFHHCPVNCHSHRFTEYGIRSNRRGAGQRWIFRFTEL